MNVVKRRIEEFWNRRFMSSNLVVDSPEDPQTSRQSKANSSENMNTETNTVQPKKRTYRKQLESDEIIAEKVKLIQQGDIGTLIKNQKSGKYGQKLSVPAKKSYIPIVNDKAPKIPAYLLGKSFHKNHLHRNKCDEKKQPIEVSSNDNDGPNIESNLSEEHDEVIKKLEANNEPSNNVTIPEVSTDKVKETLKEKIIHLEPAKYEVEEQLLEISSSESSNLKRKSSDKDEKIIKKAKINSEFLHATTSNDVTLPKVSTDNVIETPEEKITHLEPTKCGAKEQLQELSSSESQNLKRKSSEEDEKTIKKSKVSSEVSPLNMNDVLPTVSVVKIDEIPEKEIEVTHDLNTNALDQYNEPSFKSPKSWYTSDTINDYLKLIVKRSNGEVHAVVTDFIPAYLRGGYPAVRRWIKKDIHSLKLLFVPMNVLGGHWILTVVNVPERTVTSYDSLKCYDGTYPMVLKEYLTDWEMDKKGAASSWTLKIGETTRQTNGYDCGPFTVELAEKMARGDTTPINASLMPSVRLRHREEIIAGQLFQ
ncbi:sentrin-specific protease 1-like [Daktulosphaira vitifoliae]|uniref:sentrin-specific protease 1-like n=1 Tax=Daktulosphaira vitifoliae TaxID=58002 RepID=UPI0021AA09D4|nr:sentrin-specific protease 1-like [Daktulosphaira vitifoliae]